MNTEDTMASSLTIEDRVARLEDMVKAMIDGNPALVRPGGVRTPIDTTAEQLTFSRTIAGERTAAK